MWGASCISRFRGKSVSSESEYAEFHGRRFGLMFSRDHEIVSDVRNNVVNAWPSDVPELGTCRVANAKGHNSGRVRDIQ